MPAALPASARLIRKNPPGIFGCRFGLHLLLPPAVPAHIFPIAARHPSAAHPSGLFLRVLHLRRILALSVFFPAVPPFGKPQFGVSLLLWRFGYHPGAARLPADMFPAVRLPGRPPGCMQVPAALPVSVRWIRKNPLGIFGCRFGLHLLLPPAAPARILPVAARYSPAAHPSG